MLFADRTDAGVQLAPIVRQARESFAGWSVIGLARGGVITAAPIARLLDIPLQTFCVDDLDVKGVGTFFATAFGDGCLYGKEWQRGNVNPARIPDIRARHHAGLPDLVASLEERQLRYNHGKQLVVTAGVVLVDDGLVSGKTACAAIASLRAHGAQDVVLAVPVVPSWMEDRHDHFKPVWVRCSTLRKPTTGLYYTEFPDLSDDAVIAATCQG